MVEYKEMQILWIVDVCDSYEIAKVTEKAIMIKSHDGRWTSGGDIDIWIPKSIIIYNSFNDSSDNSRHGLHNVSLPTWFVNQNSKKW